jgi:hypothetical protein
MTFTIEERLKRNPHLRSRIEAILDIAEGENTGPDTADSAEERAIIEIQKLGQEVLADWARKKARKVVDAYQEENPSAKIHKKKQPTGIQLLEE